MIELINEPFIYSVPSSALCKQDVSKNCAAASFRNIVLNSQEIYNKCECIDYCSSINVDIPLRKGQNYQAWLIPGPILGITKKAGYGHGVIFVAVFLLLALLNGLSSLLEIRWTRIEVRNWVYWKLSGTYLDRLSMRLLNWKSHTYKQLDKNPHFGLAKGCAAIFYLYASIMTVVCIPIFFTVIVINEISIRRFPIGESPDAVGQWA